jgi:predicted HicB family RNase H-like nuclease
MLNTIVGFVALGISVFAVVISIVFYFKSDNLYKEMLRFISEIRVFSERTYTDTFGMVKEAWPHIWEKGEKEKIEKESDEKIKQIKEEFSKEIKQEVEKIKKLVLESAETEQFEKEVNRLNQMISKSLDESSRKLAEIEREKERKISGELEVRVPTDADINKEILRLLRSTAKGCAKAEFIVQETSRNLGVSRFRAVEALRALRDNGIIDYIDPLEAVTYVSETLNTGG